MSQDLVPTGREIVHPITGEILDLQFLAPNPDHERARKELLALQHGGYVVTRTQKNSAGSPVQKATILIQPWDATTVDAIRKALEESKLGITPLVDGKLIRLPIPPLSEERRQDLVKTVKKMAEEGRVSIRANRRHAIDEIKKIQKAGEITEDQLEDAEKEIQKLTDQYVAEIEKGVLAKEAELLKV